MSESQASQRKKPPKVPPKASASTGSPRIGNGASTTQKDDSTRLEFPQRSTTSRSASPNHNTQLPQADPATPSPKESKRLASSSHDTLTVRGRSRSRSEAGADRQGIIYKATFIDDVKHKHDSVMRYSRKPFEGLEDPGRQELAVMDEAITVYGYWPEGVKLRNQQRATFMDEPEQHFVIGKHFITRGTTHKSPTIRILSPRVLDTLRSLVKYYPDKNLMDSEVAFAWPYRLLFHYYEEIWEFRDKCPRSPLSEVPMTVQTQDLTNQYDFATRQDLDVVLGYLAPVYAKEIKPGLESHEKGVTKYEHIWLLFKPGSTVFAKVKGLLMFFKVLRFKKKESKEGADLQWVITVWGLDYDGYQIKRHSRNFDIHAYIGERDLHKLPVLPVRYLDCDQEKLISRGKLYYEFMCDAPLYRRYEGPVNGNERDKYFGDVIIDPLSYMNESSQAKKLSPGVREVLSRSHRSKTDEFGLTYDDPTDLGGGPLYSKFNDMVCSKDTCLENDQYLLLPGYVQGYALGRKEWMAFELESFPGPEEDDKPWEYLVIDEKDRQLVQSLGPTPSAAPVKEWTTDFIAGKGQGQVVLLHGPPGVGKSFTVECLAKRLDRPLLSLTVADIGTEETVVERNLSKWLTLAAKWNAIVLIDEAETYMSPRAKANLSRHALITAFLRSLEYYPGLIFLTTNTPGQIDDAFLSRIHIAIEYPALTDDQREKIWLGFLSQLEKKREDITISTTTQNFVVKYSNDPGRPLNGRDIRNAIQAAVRLAMQEAKMQKVKDKPEKAMALTTDHFKQVLENKMALKSSKDSIAGLTEGQRAHEDGARGPAKHVNSNA